jgi:glycosyltransferase involved in cell wall biosynthesis
MRILHISEAMGGGVLNIIQQLSKTQTDDDNEVIVAYSVRPDTPSSQQMDILFAPSIVRIELDMTTNISPVKDFLALVNLVKLIKHTNPDIIHLHSSKAGVLGRIACLLLKKTKKCFYTPHGFSFLRKDLSQRKRTAFSLIERFCSNLGGTTLACSKSEIEHSVNTAKQKKSILIENSVPMELIKEARGSSGSNCVISTSGRLCYQKNPSAYATIANELRTEPAEFLWIGDGELKHQLLINNAYTQNLTITGWASRDEVINHLHFTDIFVMTSLWEGMPLSLIEAQAAGLPAVVPNVEGCNDIVIDGLTGYICRDLSQMVEKVKLLIDNVALRKEMGAAARASALTRFSQQRMHQEIIAAYQTTSR